MMRKLPALALLLSLASCVAYRTEIGKKFDTLERDEDAAVVYVVRDARRDHRLQIPIEVDGELAGVAEGDTYVRVRLAPGSHEVTARGPNAETVELDAEAGKTYVLRLETGKGPSGARIKLAEVKKGKRGKKLLTGTRHVTLKGEEPEGDVWE